MTFLTCHRCGEKAPMCLAIDMWSRIGFNDYCYFCTKVINHKEDVKNKREFLKNMAKLKNE